MRVSFCNITWMDYYKGIVPGVDEPHAGGSYVKETNDAHEKYNFEPVEIVNDDVLTPGYYCLGFVETKTTRGASRNLSITSHQLLVGISTQQFTDIIVFRNFHLTMKAECMNSHIMRLQKERTVFFFQGMLAR